MSTYLVLIQDEITGQREQIGRIEANSHNHAMKQARLMLGQRSGMVMLAVTEAKPEYSFLPKCA